MAYLRPKHILRPGEDAFDSVEWDPDLPTFTAPGDSPEPVEIKPHPVAYTTVGSLVNPNVVPQFSAPNRIQREGANRRQPLLSLLQSSNSYGTMIQPPRGPPPPLNQANSMQYAQHIARSPARASAPSSTPSARSGVSTPANTIATKEEDGDMLTRHLSNLSAFEPQERSGNVTREAESPKNYSSSAALSIQQPSFKDPVAEEARSRSNSVPAGKGLEKMVTLQRLAKFENPMQLFAIGRLRELALGPGDQDRDTTPTGSSVLNTLAAQEALLKSQLSMFLKPNVNVKEAGELDRGYRFPQALSGLLERGAMAQPGQSRNRAASQASTAQARPGYPAPLSAGPPGARRQSNVPTPSAMNYHELFADGPYGSQNYNHFANGGAYYGQYGDQPSAQPSFTPAHTQPYNSDGEIAPKDRAVPILDSLNYNAVRMYYPLGFPADMTTQHSPDTGSLFAKRLANLTQDEREVKVRRHEEMFYQGQRRYFTMTADDHFLALEDSEKYYEQAKAANPFGVIGPPKKKILPPLQSLPISKEEISNLGLHELKLLPLVDSAVGTLISYTKPEIPGSNNELSHFVNMDASYLDVDDKGQASSNSYYGEDWGKAPKRASTSGWVA